MAKEVKPVPKCAICGDKSVVPRAYVEPNCGANEGRDLVKCPKCVKGK